MRKFNSSMQASTITLVFTTLFLMSTSIALSAQVTVIQSFAGFDGNNSQAALLQTMNGQLYGTTVYGGKINKGTVFEVTTSGVLTTLHSFLGPDGASPGPLSSTATTAISTAPQTSAAPARPVVAAAAQSSKSLPPAR